MTSAAALSVEHVVAGYGGVLALQDVSITARPGTITAVLGATGAGKTTLLATISGFVRPRQGQIKLDGADLARRRVSHGAAPRRSARSGAARFGAVRGATARHEVRPHRAVPHGRAPRRTALRRTAPRRTAPRRGRRR